MGRKRGVNRGVNRGVQRRADEDFISRCIWLSPNLGLAGGQVVVERIPLRDCPPAQREDGFDEEKVGEGIADRLVDQLA